MNYGYSETDLTGVDWDVDTIKPSLAIPSCPMAVFGISIADSMIALSVGWVEEQNPTIDDNQLL